MGASATTAPPGPSAITAHVLSPRLDPDAISVQEARPEVLGALAESKRLVAAGRRKDALARLAGARRLDPTGAVLALELSRLSVATGDPSATERWVRVAQLGAVGHGALEKAAFMALAPAEERTGVTAAPNTRVPSVGGPFPSVMAACDAILAQLAVGRGSRLLELHGVSTLKSRCSPEQVQQRTGPQLKQAMVIRAAAGEEGELELGWVAVTSPAGVLTYGPVAEAFTPALHRLVNDFAIDLQQTDALHGGEPEVVVRTSERWTLADVALNEAALIDRTRVVLLTMDRGRLEPSVELMLSERVERKVIDREDKKPAPGWLRSKSGVSAFDLRVEWGASNEIRLVRPVGDRKVPRDGAIQLFL